MEYLAQHDDGSLGWEPASTSPVAGGYEIVTAAWTSNPQTVSAPTGKKVVSGGVDASAMSSDSPALHENHPTSDGSGWVFATSDWPLSGAPILYIVCING